MIFKTNFKTNNDNWNKSEPARSCKNSAVCQIAIETITDWHQQLAHQNYDYDYIQKILMRNNIKLKEDEFQNTYKDCLIDKQYRNLYLLSKSRSELIVSLFTEMRPTETPFLGSARYFLC